MSCQNLRPSSGREHTVITYSVGRSLLMNETRRKPAAGTGCPTLFDKWHGIFYMPSRKDMAGHIRAFYHPVDHWWESQGGQILVGGRLEPTACRSTVDHANHQTTRPPIMR